VLKAIHGVGAVTIEVVLSELGTSRASAMPRQSVPLRGSHLYGRKGEGKKAKDRAISKEGSGLSRWVLVEAIRRIVHTSPKWRGLLSKSPSGPEESEPSLR
jgi:hypothetical protein